MPEVTSVQLSKTRQQINAEFEFNKDWDEQSRLVVNKASGAYLYDTDNNEFVDFSFTQGSHILGYPPEHIALTRKSSINLEPGKEMNTAEEKVLAKLIRQVIPSIEQVNLTGSSHDAVIGAIRQALAFTGRKRIIKFKGSNHGMFSHLGIPDEFARLTLNLPFNDELAVFEAFELFKNEIAAVIVEPVQTGIGVILPQNGFLNFLRNITTQNNTLLIFDEVTTGFRPKVSGAQGLFNILPDITILGKVLGGGYAIGAWGGPQDILSVKLPSGENYSFTAINPSAVAAGITVLKKLQLPQFYEPLNHKSRDFIFWMNELSQKKGIRINAFFSMYSIYFSEEEVTDFASANRSDRNRYNKFSRQAFNRGILFPQSQFRTNFISAAHLPKDLNKTLDAVYQILKTI